MAAQPISLEAVWAYCRLNGVRSVRERQRILFFVGLLDSEWLRFHGEESEKAEKAKREAERRKKARDRAKAAKG